MLAAPGQSRGAAQASNISDALARRGAPFAPRKARGSCCNLSSSGIARRFSSSSTPTPTPSSCSSSSSSRRLLLPPARSSFSRIPIESLDYDRASDNERRRRRAARRRRHEDDDDDDDGDEGDEYDDADFGDGEKKRRAYSDAAFNDDEDASGLEPSFPGTALPGSQVARLKDLAAQSAARRDFHWRYYKAQSAKR